MGKELAEPDWSPLTSTEVRTVLARYPQPGARPPIPAAPDGLPAPPGLTPRPATR